MSLISGIFQMCPRRVQSGSEEPQPAAARCYAVSFPTGIKKKKRALVAHGLRGRGQIQRHPRASTEGKASFPNGKLGL